MGESDGDGTPIPLVRKKLPQKTLSERIKSSYCSQIDAGSDQYISVDLGDFDPNLAGRTALVPVRKEGVWGANGVFMRFNYTAYKVSSEGIIMPPGLPEYEHARDFSPPSKMYHVILLDFVEW